MKRNEAMINELKELVKENQRLNDIILQFTIAAGYSEDGRMMRCIERLLEKYSHENSK